MRFECLAPQDLPPTSRLHVTYLTDFEALRTLYAHGPTLDGVRAAAAEVSAGYDSGRRRAVAGALLAQNAAFGAGADVQQSLARLETGAVAVVAGQQVGLFSGPAYSLYKALTALRVARDLNAAGINAVPVFWLAGEDHDLAEVNHCDWPGPDGLEHLELPHDPQVEGRRVGEIRLGDAVSHVLDRALTALAGSGEKTIGAALRASYGAHETYSSSFAKLLTRLLAGRGLILLDPLDPALGAQAQPMVARALRENGTLIRALLERGRALEKAGFHMQVKVSESATLLFAMIDGRRIPLRVRNGNFVAGERTFTPAEAEARLAGTVGALSPSALLRPVLQDTLLPTAAYIAGPAELAYLGQSAVLYRQLLGRMPAILPRAGFTLVEPHVARILRKYRLTVKDVLHGPHHLRRRLERESVPRALARQMTIGERNIGRYLRSIRKPLAKLDATLGGALDTAERKILYQLEKLRTKAGRSADRRAEILERHERILRDALYPHHALQSRTVCPLPILARHGLELLDALEERSGSAIGSPGAACHQVVFL